mgnify:CR=1 FL=1
MNACTHLYQSTCPRYPRKPSSGICKRCDQYTDSGNARVPLTLSATRKQVQPVPRAEWPLWAIAISKLATDADSGIGDVVDRELGRLGVAFKATMKALGVPCGCNARRSEWNAKFPLNN